MFLIDQMLAISFVNCFYKKLLPSWWDTSEQYRTPFGLLTEVAFLVHEQTFQKMCDEVPAQNYHNNIKVKLSSFSLLGKLVYGRVR